MISSLRTLALLVAVASLAAACGDDSSVTTEPDGVVSLDGAWVLTAATVDGTDLSLRDDHRVTMTIEGSSIGGRAACNTYGGTLTIDDSRISIGALSQTEMGCEQAIMEIEAAFLGSLGRVTSGERDGDTARLTGDGVDLAFSLLPPVPTAELVDTTWLLDTIIDGDTTSSTLAGADPATLRLDADGTFTGGTGCRTLTGDYVVSGDTVVFTSFAAEGDCVAELQDLDSQVISRLEGGFRVAIEGDRLTLSSDGGQGLSYTAG